MCSTQQKTNNSWSKQRHRRATERERKVYVLYRNILDNVLEHSHDTIPQYVCCCLLTFRTLQTNRQAVRQLLKAEQQRIIIESVVRNGLRKSSDIVFCVCISSFCITIAVIQQTEFHSSSRQCFSSALCESFPLQPGNTLDSVIQASVPHAKIYYGSITQTFATYYCYIEVGVVPSAQTHSILKGNVHHDIRRQI